MGQLLFSWLLANIIVTIVLAFFDVPKRNCRLTNLDYVYITPDLVNRAIAIKDVESVSILRCLDICLLLQTCKTVYWDTNRKCTMNGSGHLGLTETEIKGSNFVIYFDIAVSHQFLPRF